MGQTHPNAYLTEAQSKREQAAQLLAEADTLESKAVDLGAELPTQKKDSEPDEQVEEQAAEPSGPEDAASDVETEEQVDQSEDSGNENESDSSDLDDPHNRRSRRHR